MARSKDVKRKAVAEQMDQAYAIRKIFGLAKSLVGNKPVAQRETEVHTLLFSALLNQENNMRKFGIEIPSDYVEDRIEAKCRPGQKVAPLYVLCKRCQFVKVDKDGVRYCGVLRNACDASRYYIADDDGCSRGLLREEYR